MPIQLRFVPRRLEQDEFTKIAYEVLGHTFDIHNEFGRFFDEKIYKRELGRRVPELLIEERIEVTFEPFHKTYYLDVLACSGAIFEFKAVEALVDRHRSQLMNYLMLADLPRGVLANVRTERVQHEFVNCTLRPADRFQMNIVTDRWYPIVKRDSEMRDWFCELLNDLGAGLDVGLYEAALTDFLGGEDQVVTDVDVLSEEYKLGVQSFRLSSPTVAFKITALTDELEHFEIHARRLLVHSALHAIHWVNVNRSTVTFTTIRK